jgi:drug/metabolite transporter (DMT)-like permease
MSLNRTQRHGFLYAFLGVLLFSASLPFTKLALKSFDPLLTAFARPLIACTLAVPFMLYRKVPMLPRDLWRPMFFTTLGAVFGWPILIALALDRSTSEHVAVIAAIMPLTTAIIATLKYRRRASNQFWIASILGTTLLVLFALSRGGAKGENGIADLLTCGAVLASSYCYVEGAGLTSRLPGWQVISWIVVVGAPVSLIGATITYAHTRHAYHFHVSALIGLLAIGYSSMYLGFFAWYRGLKDLGVTHGSQVQQFQAIMTLGWSALFLHEHISFQTLLAAVGIVLCVLWAITTANSV